MDTGMILAIALGLLCGGCVYVFLEYRHFGERQSATDRLLKIQAEHSATRKELLGYTRYADDLAATRTMLADNQRTVAARVAREFTHVEIIPREPLRLKSIVTVVVRYTVEGTFGMDLKLDSCEVLRTDAGIELRVRKPTLMGFPTAKLLSAEIVQEGVLPNEPVTLHEIQQKLPALAQRHGDAMATEDVVRALCEKKLVDAVRNFLGKQPGVKHLPFIAVVYK